MDISLALCVAAVNPEVGIPKAVVAEIAVERAEHPLSLQASNSYSYEVFASRLPSTYAVAPISPPICSNDPPPAERYNL